MTDPPWPPANDAFLRAYLNILGVKCCARRLGVEEEIVREKGKKLKIGPVEHHRSGRWTGEQTLILEHLLRAAVRLTGHRPDTVVRRMRKRLDEGFRVDGYEDVPVPAKERTFPADGGPDRNP